MRRSLIAVVLAALGLLTGCADVQSSLDALNGGSTAPPAASPVNGAGTPSQTGCTARATTAAEVTSALAAAQAGAKICVTALSLGGRLTVSKSGTAAAPITIVGTGKTVTAGITVKASDVVVDGFTADGPQAPGIELTGNNIVARNNTISRPTGGDGDGIRFFGNNIHILNNTVRNTSNSEGHADCMQTFTSGRPSSLNARIEANRCEKIANICLMAEGPGDVGDGGGGNGTSANWTFSRNFCEFGSAQGVMIEAVQNVRITDNTFVGRSKAIGLDIKATGATVSGNKLQGFSCEVGMDSSSRPGYKGPAPCSGP